MTDKEKRPVAPYMAVGLSTVSMPILGVLRKNITRNWTAKSETLQKRCNFN